MSDGTRTRGRRDHNPELYQLSYAHQARRSIAAIRGADSREAMRVMVHLTFDDGPDPVWTPAVLQALAAANATATFFVLGERAAAWPAVVERVLEAGHGVEVHGHGHLRHPATQRECVEGDLDAALEVLAALGIRPRLWRVPYGEPAPVTAEIAAARGLDLIGWTADTNDWRGHTAEEMLAAVEPHLVPRAIVLAHDALGPGALRDTCAETVRLIPILVAAARKRGLEPAQPSRQRTVLRSSRMPSTETNARSARPGRSSIRSAPAT